MVWCSGYFSDTYCVAWCSGYLRVSQMCVVWCSVMRGVVWCVKWRGVVYCVVWSGVMCRVELWSGVVWCVEWSGIMCDVVWRCMMCSVEWYNVWCCGVWCAVWCSVVWSVYKQTQILYSPSCSYDFPYIQEIPVCQWKFSFPFSIRQNYNLCQLCPIWPTLLPQTLAYTLPVFMSLFPSLMFHFPLF